METAGHLVESPITTHEGQASEHEHASVDSATAIESSPVPIRPGHHHSPSSTRKRTNEEIYESTKSLSTTPTASRFRKSVPAASQPGDQLKRSTSSPESHGPLPQQDVRLAQLTTTGRAGPERSGADKFLLSISPSSSHTLVHEIENYQQQLELEFQEFERSLNERDPAEDLEVMDWDGLEARYDEEIQPKIAAEQEIMNEFSARFEQFMLYMHVSADHEAERAIKRLRTRTAIAQISEASLAQKKAHHAKVLEAFQSAMSLLNA
ncbi:hypothetical protein A1O3_03893 [Capronia epimyces CBS 606.96]|uniref:Uncharacterized protein n=1 Tax=Capronia epimyces CBS 606.96 TaxID=1182542 RepID=W9YXC4_9EURO|nr:uncharacterized protein A1O3_03893 [Capronia epimyces CBS 606.96]EXJ86939.1 hypothetical protein A1O3_03893 [Capronia epimyces CBS 606.96]